MSPSLFTALALGTVLYVVLAVLLSRLASAWKHDRRLRKQETELIRTINKMDRWTELMNSRIEQLANDMRQPR